MKKADIKPDIQLRLYEWQTQEYLLIDWYSQLVASGDMYVTFAPDMRYMSNFLTFFRGHAILGYDVDEKGIWFAFWVEPCMSGAYAGVWIREDKRHAPSSFKLLSKAYDEAFKVYTVIIGMSKQFDHRELHAKLGYTHACTIPGLWNGDEVDIHYLTREQWNHRKEHRGILGKV